MLPVHVYNRTFYHILLMQPEFPLLLETCPVLYIDRGVCVCLCVCGCGRACFVRLFVFFGSRFQSSELPPGFSPTSSEKGAPLCDSQ